jgi:hypothetical protein
MAEFTSNLAGFRGSAGVTDMDWTGCPAVFRRRPLKIVSTEARPIMFFPD